MNINALKNEILRLNKLSREDHFKEKLQFEDFKNLVTINLVEFVDQTIDFLPSAITFAMAKEDSLLECLSAYEIYIKKPNEHTFFMLTSTLYEKHRYEHPGYFEWIEREKDMFLSTIVRLEYIKENFKVNYVKEWLNVDKEISDIEYKQYIERAIPYQGIPKDRDVTKNLQTFFKDTLMHEFDHSCPICKLEQESNLIASHIRPFRDCHHIYEAFDNNNGLLLCKEHDYLFDQGFISFNDDGTILLSEYLDSNQIPILKDIVLPKKYRTKNRLAYINVHRNTIFKK